jgi:hypothetical protein
MNIKKNREVKKISKENTHLKIIFSPNTTHIIDDNDDEILASFLWLSKGGGGGGVSQVTLVM